jgi:hypothetical protein
LANKKLNNWPFDTKGGKSKAPTPNTIIIIPAVKSSLDYATVYRFSQNNAHVLTTKILWGLKFDRFI